MKRYKDYMDGVEVSDTLHEKLKHLDEPKKQSQPWVKWGAMAAAFALVVGVGAWGLSRGEGGWGALEDNFRPNGDWDALTDNFESVPDIAFEDPEMPQLEPGQTPGREPFYSYGYELVGDIISPSPPKTP